MLFSHSQKFTVFDLVFEVNRDDGGGLSHAMLRLQTQANCMASQRIARYVINAWIRVFHC